MKNGIPEDRFVKVNYVDLSFGTIFDKSKKRIERKVIEILDIYKDYQCIIVDGPKKDKKYWNCLVKHKDLEGWKKLVLSDNEVINFPY